MNNQKNFIYKTVNSNLNLPVLNENKPNNFKKNFINSRVNNFSLNNQIKKDDFYKRK
jgi:hypothetical protein